MSTTVGASFLTLTEAGVDLQVALVQSDFHKLVQAAAQRHKLQQQQQTRGSTSAELHAGRVAEPELGAVHLQQHVTCGTVKRHSRCCSKT